jgi:hypothetical protein
VGNLVEEVLGDISARESRLWLSGILTLPSVEANEEPEDEGVRIVLDDRLLENFLGLFFKSVGRSKELV